MSVINFELVANLGTAWKLLVASPNHMLARDISSHQKSWLAKSQWILSYFKYLDKIHTYTPAAFVFGSILPHTDLLQFSSSICPQIALEIRHQIAMLFPSSCQMLEKTVWQCWGSGRASAVAAAATTQTHSHPSLCRVMEWWPDQSACPLKSLVP